MKLRPIGTCEHIWSPWLPVAERSAGWRWVRGLHEDGFEFRECELCWGYQWTQTSNDGRKRALEEGALAADLTGAKP